jgi:hypothetical protein
MKKLINEQFKRMQLLAGLITESQYEAEKKMLSENPVKMSMQEFMPKIDEITKKMNIHLMPQVLEYNDFISKMKSIKGDFSKAGVTGDKTAVIAATGLNGQADTLVCFSLSDDPTNPKDSFKLINNFYEVVKKEFPTTTFKQGSSAPYDVTGEFAKLHGEKVVVGMAVITNFVKPAAAAAPTSESIDLEEVDDIALRYSNTAPNTPPGATAGEKPMNEANEDAGKFMNTIFSTAKILGLVQMNMTDENADTKKYTATFQKEGFPPNSHGILGVEKISNGAAVSILIMTDDKAKLDKLEDVIDNAKGNFKPDGNFSNKARIYKIENAAKDKEAFAHLFHIDLTSSPAPTSESIDIEKSVNEALRKYRKNK